MKKDENNNNYIFDKEGYVHRQGRTGRFGKNGKVYNFIASASDLVSVKHLNSELFPDKHLEGIPYTDILNQLSLIK